MKIVKMVTITEELMEVDKENGLARKRKSMLPPPMPDPGKRTKFESFPKAAAKMTVSVTSLPVLDEENDSQCKLTKLNCKACV